MATLRVYFVHRNAGHAVFVKEGVFFVRQGGGNEPWGRNWRPVVATSIEDARAVGERVLPKVAQ